MRGISAKMRILITGITGFAGSHLAEYIMENHPDAEIFGLRHWRSRLENISHIEHRLRLIEADLKDESSITRALKESKPNWIFHLAAHSYVPTSWRMPAEVIINNVAGEVNLFEAARRICPRAKIHVAGSSEEYGLVKAHEIPIKETNPLRPLSTYAVSKVAQDLLAWQYYKSYGMRIVRTRAFNHTGPRRGEVFVCSAFAKQIAKIEIGTTKTKNPPVITVGNLEAVRDFTDVRDMARAYWLVLEKAKAGEVYNIGSGRQINMKNVLSLLLDIAQIKAKVVINPDQYRPSDVPILACDYSKFAKRTGWKPKIEFKQTMTDLLNYWRNKIMQGEEEK